MQYQFRHAQISDARDICDLLHRSIRSLCVEDHHGDAKVLSQWLGIKSSENMTN